MAFELPELPYAHDALEPHISAETLRYHHGKHHQAYVNKLNELTADSEMAKQTLESLIQNSEGAVFNNAAQIWNHSFYWQCMAPNAGGEPTGPLAEAIQQAFGSFATCQAQFTQAALTQFGSGWTWLIRQNDGQLKITSTGNANTPLRNGDHALLCCDVWEHAYYIDTRNDRPQYLQNFWEVVNWDFVAQRLADAR